MNWIRREANVKSNSNTNVTRNEEHQKGADCRAKERDKSKRWDMFHLKCL